MTVDIEYFFRGMAVGFAVSTPVGYVGLYCVRKMFTVGRLHGFFSGLGAAAADGVFAGLAMLGLGVLSSFLMTHQFAIRVVAGILVTFIGLRIVRTVPSPLRLAPPRALNLAGDFAGVFLLAFTNPMGIIVLTGVLAAMGLSLGEAGYSGVASLVLGVGAGSASWWVILGLLAGYLKGRLDTRILLWINRISGAVIAGFGLTILLSLLVRGR
jgi:threonine/homoserine/homoserine lactone efflux protein